MGLQCGHEHGSIEDTSRRTIGSAGRREVGNPGSSCETDPVMEFAFSESQRQWYEAAVKFAREELSDPESVERERRGEFWREGYERCAEFGVQGLPVPTEYGGRGQDLLTTAAAMEGLGYGCADTGLVFAHRRARSGRSRWRSWRSAPRRRNGGTCPGFATAACWVPTPPASPKPAPTSSRMQTRAERARRRLDLERPQDLDHERARPPTSSCASPARILPRACSESRRSCVERGTPGFGDGRADPDPGLAHRPMGELVLENCVVPADAILGREGRGSTVFNAALEWERGAILAGILGTMRRQLEACIAHARARKQFGQPIAKFQSVSNRIVDMKLRLETSRFMVYRYAWATSHGDDAAAWSSMAKLHVSECFVQNSLDAMRCFGASGFAVRSAS